MGEGVLRLSVNGWEVPYRHSIKARKISVKIDARGKIELIIPKRVSMKAAQAFLDGSLEWITQNYNPVTSEVLITDGVCINICGSMCKVVFSSSAGITHIDNKQNIIVHARNGEHTHKLKQFLYNHLLQKISEIITCRNLPPDLQPRKIRIREMLSCWGTCSSHGDITLAFHLIFAPVQALEYVVMHEISHIRHKGHDEKFWAQVAQLMPDYKVWRKWLKTNTHEIGKHRL